MAFSFNSFDYSVGDDGARKGIAYFGQSMVKGVTLVALSAAVGGMALAGMGAGIAAGMARVAFGPGR